MSDSAGLLRAAGATRSNTRSHIRIFSRFIASPSKREARLNEAAVEVWLTRRAPLIAILEFKSCKTAQIIAHTEGRSREIRHRLKLKQRIGFWNVNEFPAVIGFPPLFEKRQSIACLDIVSEAVRYRSRCREVFMARICNLRYDFRRLPSPDKMSGCNPLVNRRATRWIHPVVVGGAADL